MWLIAYVLVDTHKTGLKLVVGTWCSSSCHSIENHKIIKCVFHALHSIEHLNSQVRLMLFCIFSVQCLLRSSCNGFYSRWTLLQVVVIRRCGVEIPQSMHNGSSSGVIIRVFTSWLRRSEITRWVWYPKCSEPRSYVVFEREAREFNSFHFFTFLFCHSHSYRSLSLVSLTPTARKFTWKSTLECGLDCDVKSNTSARTQVLANSARTQTILHDRLCTEGIENSAYVELENVTYWGVGKRYSFIHITKKITRT